MKCFPGIDVFLVVDTLVKSFEVCVCNVFESGEKSAKIVVYGTVNVHGLDSVSTNTGVLLFPLRIRTQRWGHVATVDCSSSRSIITEASALYLLLCIK